MKEQKFTDHIKAQAAIAYLISQGWDIDLAAARTSLGEDLSSQDWIDIANVCMNFIMNKLNDDHKIIPLNRFKK